MKTYIENTKFVKYEASPVFMGKKNRVKVIIDVPAEYYEDVRFLLANHRPNSINEPFKIVK